MLLLWAPQLCEAELKVLLYIVRRTLGFHKRADAISLTQFARSIVTKDGRILDHGCGIRHRTTLLRAVEALEEKGLIAATKAETPRGQRAVTVYALRWDEDEQDATGWGATADRGAPHASAHNLSALQNRDPRDAAHIWRAVVDELAGVLSLENVAQWVTPAHGLARDGQCLRVAVPSAAHRHWLDVRLRRRVDVALADAGYGDLMVTFEVAP